MSGKGCGVLSTSITFWHEITSPGNFLHLENLEECEQILRDASLAQLMKILRSSPLRETDLGFEFSCSPYLSMRGHHTFFKSC